MLRPLILVRLIPSDQSNTCFVRDERAQILGTNQPDVGPNEGWWSRLWMFYNIIYSRSWLSIEPKLWFRCHCRQAQLQENEWVTPRAINEASPAEYPHFLLLPPPGFWSDFSNLSPDPDSRRIVTRVIIGISTALILHLPYPKPSIQYGGCG